MNLQQIKELDKKHFMGVFGERFSVLFEDAKGVSLFDKEGKEYIDFLAGIAVNCLGYGDEGYAQVIAKQASSIMHISNYFYNETQAKLAELLCSLTGMQKIFLANSGAEANEGAIKLARKHFFKKGENRKKIITLSQSFHGRTLATLAATGQEKFHVPFYPLIESFEYVEANNVDALIKAVDENTCAVMMEVIQGEGGVTPLTQEFVEMINTTCRKNGALIIVDEIQTGMGRTGKFLASQHYNLKPDIITLAKALGNGVPCGCILAAESVCDAFDPGDHGSTFGGNHIACAAAYYTVNKVINDGLIERCGELGEYFKNKLLEIKNKYPFVLDVRGAGLMLGMELDEKVSAKAIQKELLSRGFVICSAGRNTMRFLPPYIIETKHIDMLTQEIDKIFSEL